MNVKSVKGRTARSRLGQGLRWAGVFVILALVAITADAWKAMGRGARGERRARMEHSPEWKEGHFDNPQPLINDAWGSVSAMFHPSPDVSPSQPLPFMTGDHHRFDTPPATGLRVTWFGHSSTLVELDGYRVLTDPIWSERSSPLSWIGPRRWYAPTMALGELAPLDAVVISHDHYDHLDYAMSMVISAIWVGIRADGPSLG